MDMTDRQKLFDALLSSVVSCGAAKAAVIRASGIVLNHSFREMCAANVCGNYGHCWMCPPDAGDIEALMRSLSAYDHVLVYQTIHKLTTGEDQAEMLRVGNTHNHLAQRLRIVFSDAGISNALHIGAGGCRLCNVCAKRTGEPCLHPKRAMPALEAYGIDVSRMADAAGMQYRNGVNTVTYFGAIFFCV